MSLGLNTTVSFLQVFGEQDKEAEGGERVAQTETRRIQELGFVGGAAEVVPSGPDAAGGVPAGGRVRRLRHHRDAGGAGRQGGRRKVTEELPEKHHRRR